MFTRLKLTLIATSLCVLSGCVASVGKENFTCNNMDKGGVCAGPRDIYELTNNRESLENLSVEDLHAQVHGHSEDAEPVREQVGQGAREQAKLENVYVPRSIEQQGSMNYQKAELAPNASASAPSFSDFNRWPHNGEPMAPEAMAMMEEPKPMRIMVNSYTDANGVFHVPGFVFVNTQQRTWIKGSASDLRPTRVVPLELQKQSQQGIERVNRQRQGVSPLGVVIGQNTQQGN